MHGEALILSFPTLFTCLNVAVWYSGVLRAPYMSNEFSKLVRIVATLGSFASRTTLKTFITHKSELHLHQNRITGFQIIEEAKKHFNLP